MATRISNAIRQIGLRDFLAPFIFLMILIPSLSFRLINKIKHRKLWLIAEQGEARDNGYYFYKYIREKRPKDFCFYAVRKKSAGYEKVAKLGNTIPYGSLKHWLYYMSANLNISSQKSGNPCPIFWYFVHVTLGLYRNRVFLQHGIIKDDLDFAYFKNTNFKYFVCGAEREYDYILKKFGYNKKQLIFAGLARWDELENKGSKKSSGHSILIMPTWRNWLGGEKIRKSGMKNFEETEYYKSWSLLLTDAKFIEWIEKNNIKIYFYPHINMQNFLKCFETNSKNIELVNLEVDIQKLLKECDLMVTDYSSAVFDFAYLQKPVIYYQFDEKEYRKKQHKKGYFDYKKDGFGDVVISENQVVRKIKFYSDNNYNPEPKYKKRMDEFFSLRDKNNSKRIYEAIK